MNTKKTLNIKKIAELAGVSKATVSRVLNNYPHISPEMRDRVLQVINETGYARNPIARMLTANRSNMIGLVIPTGAKFVFSDPYFPKLTEGISRAANQHKLTLSLFLFHSEDDGVETIRNVIANGMFDGLLVTGDRIDDNILPLLIKHDIRFVLIGRPLHHADVHYIDSDNYAGGRLATEYLIQRGYRRIGIVTVEHNIAGVDRFNGYLQALTDHGIAYDPSLVAYGDFSMDSGACGVATLLPHQPDAIFIVSDTMTLGALRLLRERQIHVPDDLGIMGFDDLPPAIQADPQLTTIRQPIDRQGALAVETMLQIIENPERPLRQVTLPVELVVRASTR